LQQAELTALSGAISNLARVLYLLLIRPSAHSSTHICAPLNFKQIQETLNKGGSEITLGREINELVQELLSTGLLESTTVLSEDSSLNGCQFRLPLIAKNTDHQLHQKRFRLPHDWEPDSNTLKDIAALTGLLQASYNPHELGDFIVYWLGRPEQQFSEWQWTQKFVMHLRKTRQVQGYNPYKTTGYQQTEKQAEVLIDENTRKLIDKYHGKS